MDGPDPCPSLGSGDVIDPKTCHAEAGHFRSNGMNMHRGPRDFSFLNPAP